MTLYRIVCDKTTTLNDLLSQVRAIKEFPATMYIYDRMFVISDEDEAWALTYGLELGYLIAEEFGENNHKKAI